MSVRESFFQSVIVWAVLALALELFAPPVRATQGPSGAPHGAAFEEVDAYIARQMDRLHIPGAVLGIVEGDEIVHLRGFGQARPGGEVPSPHTPFVLGSTTKSFTALAVMQLVEVGKIELDAPVRHYLPWFRVADPLASAQMTVRHLLNQTSGLPQMSGLLPLADFDSSPGARERQARALSTLVLIRPVGSAFEYSNMNYNLLGLIIEAASGKSYEAYIQDHIFGPLEMRHSHATRAEAEQDGLAVGYRYWFGFPIPAPHLAIPRGSVPSGQLISSAEDMSHYLIGHLNEGRYRDAHILSAEGISELHRPAVQATFPGVAAGQYGMGWFIGEIGRTRVTWHFGTVPDFFSYMALLPDQQKGVVLLINANHLTMTLPLIEVGVGVSTLLAGNQPEPTRFGAIPWVLRALLLIPVLQIVGVAATGRLLRRWRQDRTNRPGSRRKWMLYVLLSQIPHLLVAPILLILLGTGTLGLVLLFMPDVSWMAVTFGSFALIWMFVGTGLIRGTLRKPPPSRPLAQQGDTPV